MDRRGPPPREDRAAAGLGHPGGRGRAADHRDRRLRLRRHGPPRPRAGRPERLRRARADHGVVARRAGGGRRRLAHLAERPGRHPDPHRRPRRRGQRPAPLHHLLRLAARPLRRPRPLARRGGRRLRHPDRGRHRRLRGHRARRCSLHGGRRRLRHAVRGLRDRSRPRRARPARGPRGDHDLGRGDGLEPGRPGAGPTPARAARVAPGARRRRRRPARRGGGRSHLRGVEPEGRERGRGQRGRRGRPRHCVARARHHPDGHRCRAGRDGDRGVATPRGIEPWQGAAVLREDLDPSTVTAWFSGAIADDVLTIEMRGKRPRLGRGPKADDVDAVTADILRKLFGNREVVDLDGYDSQFASAWTKVEQRQDAWIAASGWWSSRPPAHHRPRGGGCLAGVALLVAAVALGLVGAFLAGLLGSRGGGIASLVLVAVGVPLITALVAYRPLLARRTANGSAYALQVASFRRFLVESEGQYVEWAWKNGLLRQYSAWAVALDAADAWKAAMERAGVPQPEIEATTTPLLLAHAQGALLATRTEPSTSSSSGSSGFSSGGFSGSVGGGGGGGSHGSW
ncbi:MAG: DUF2207 domain-containing protein [Acidimicrobiales bacterium]